MSVTLEDEFGDIVKKARFGMGFTISHVAHNVGLSEDEVSCIESYQRTVTEAESRAFAKSLKLNADALWRIARDQYVPRAPVYSEDIKVIPFVFPPMDSNGYLLHLEESGDTFLIDAGGDPKPIVDTLRDNSWKLTAVLITHGHGDHVEGVAEVRRITGAPIYAHSSEWIGDGLIPIERVGQEGDVKVNHSTDGDHSLVIGSTQINVLASPGHTPNGYVFVIKDLAFVGDTLFAGSLGRALNGPEYYGSLLASSRRLMKLPSATTMFPGHGPTTTVGEERVNNPFIA